MPLEDLARVATETLAPHRPSYVRLPLGWPGKFCRFEHPQDYIGFDGGGGIGSGPGNGGRRRARAARPGFRSASRRGARRRRLPDGRDRALDRRPLSRAGADPRCQQRIVLQRRAASGARGAAAQSAGGKPLDRHADERSRRWTSPRSRVRKAPAVTVRYAARTSFPRRCGRRSTTCAAARLPSSTRAWRPSMHAPFRRRCCDSVPPRH